MPQWYYGSPAGQSGPVEEHQLRELIASGQLVPETLLWRDGMKDWVRLDSLAEFGPGLPGPYAPPGSYHPGYYQPVQNSGLAIASLVCGILAVLTCYLGALPGIPAVICGHMAISAIRNAPVPMAGRGMAIAGLVLGYLGILFTVGVLVVLGVTMLSHSF